MLSPPVELMRPVAVRTMPRLANALWQPKVDGWRAACFIGADGVQIQARSGRIITDRFPELGPALAGLPSGCVLDGEMVAWRPDESGELTLDFLSLARTPARRRMLGVSMQFLAFDLLCDDGQDVRSLPLSDRWPRLLAVLDGAPPLVQPIVSTHDREQAEEWAAALVPRGFEGLVAKRWSSPYGEPRSWFKRRYADTVDGTVVDVVDGHALRVRLGGGRQVVTEPLSRVQARELAEVMAERTDADAPLTVEVRVGAGRHGTVAFVRARPDV